jgi:hypothetical protein
MFVLRETNNSESAARTKKLFHGNSGACFTWNAQKCLFHVEQTFCERRSNVLIVRMQAFELAIRSNDLVSARRVLRRASGRDAIGFELVVRLSRNN